MNVLLSSSTGPLPQRTFGTFYMLRSLGCVVSPSSDLLTYEEIFFEQWAHIPHLPLLLVEKQANVDVLAYHCKGTLCRYIYLKETRMAYEEYANMRFIWTTTWVHGGA